MSQLSRHKSLKKGELDKCPVEEDEVANLSRHVEDAKRIAWAVIYFAYAFVGLDCVACFNNVGLI